MRRIYRSSTDKRIAGLCGGVGQMLGIDPTLVRLAVVFLCITPALPAVLVTYLVAWAIVPEDVPEEGLAGHGI